ncbi:unnamed protein product, partial [Amoebophrya sp. A120]
EAHREYARRDHTGTPPAVRKSRLEAGTNQWQPHDFHATELWELSDCYPWQPGPARRLSRSPAAPACARQLPNPQRH